VYKNATFLCVTETEFHDDQKSTTQCSVSGTHAYAELLVGACRHLPYPFVGHYLLAPNKSRVSGYMWVCGYRLLWTSDRPVAETR
jgi:hypothetical protein